VKLGRYPGSLTNTVYGFSAFPCRDINSDDTVAY